MRAALYWAPGVDDPLWALGSAWLGRDAATGAEVAQPGVPRLPDLTSTARIYGFHCTLRSPMRLTGGLAAFCEAGRAAVRGMAPFALPALAPRDFDGFLALDLTAPCPPMQALADACVRHTDALRAPLSAAEAERRRAARLSRRQEALLRRWGYPYVMEEWFFHCTLTRRLAPAEKAPVAAAALAHFGSALQAPRLVDAVCVFVQEEGGLFRIAARLPLG